MNIRIEKTTCPKAHQDESKLGFGRYFTDHMFLMDYTPEEGWHDARIVPYGPLSLSPAATVLHYGVEIFEGMKAYRRADGVVQLFRPWDNFSRMNDSAERLCLPQIDPEFAEEALETLLKLDEAWVPSLPGTSLYIRPFEFGADPFLGLHTVHHSMFGIILSPSGSYYAEGINPVKIMIETRDVRAVRGGTGYAKCGGNYAASSRAGMYAEKKGYTQVLWLDGVERKYVEEVGAMNVMFMIDGKVITPALLGSVLPGITRRSCIQLLKDWGYEVEERQLSAEEIFTALGEGRLQEAWGCGTAAVVSPIGELSYHDKKYTINNFEIGPVTQRLYDELTGIQYGRLEDRHGWTKPLK
ncbi:MAG TPA: branched-chain amino acid aminotransferase [Candidatus Aphodomonas merdavium]|nr:branched-chain amino acid aminotransferase [Candidatus Aphodomonas merdavium]